VIEPGTRAPDFTLSDHEGQEVTLSELRGRKILLVFYPADFSPVCTDQLSVYEEVLAELRERGVTAIGISVDSSWTHRAFREKLGVSMPLLADFHPKGEVAAAYGAYVDRYGTSNRSLVLIDEDGIVEWVHESPSAVEVPGTSLIFDALERVPADR
jgi:peroxiredoxin